MTRVSTHQRSAWPCVVRAAGSVLLLLIAAMVAPARVAWAQSPSEQLRLLGEVRVRGEAERPAGLDTTDAFTLLRTRIGAEARLSQRALVFVQIQDSRTFGEEVSTVDGSADRMDLHQGWLQYGSTPGRYAWSVRVGRQALALGNERLVGAVGWSNTGRAFDAARLTFGRSEQSARSWSVTGIAANVQERGRRFTGEQAQDADHLLLGAFLAAGTLEGFVFHDAAARYRQFTSVDRTTTGARISVPDAAGLTASVEAVYQFGNQLLDGSSTPDVQDISAYLLGGRVGYATPFTALPRLGLGLDVLSGDDDVDGTYRAFNTMYATNHKFYGYIDLFLDPSARTRDRGLVNGMAAATIALPGALALDIDAHGFWLHRAFSDSDDRLIGWELDLTMPVRLGAGQQLHLGYSAFRNGSAAPLIGLGRESDFWHWAYIQATFSFGGSAPPAL